MASHGDITKITMIHQKITKHPHVQGKGPTTGGQEEDVDETPREAPSKTTVTWATGDPKLIQLLVNDGETKNHRIHHSCWWERFFFKVSETVFLIRGLQFSSLDLQGAPVDLVKNAIDIHGIDRLSRSMAVPESQQS